jgi:hypothetical protein
MATIDLSRSATNFVKHFESTRMQQGRVLTDDDFNEQVRLTSEESRKTRVHVIGPSGSPDDGFRIALPQVVNGKLTFVIKAGTFYLGGLRLVLENDEFYHLQKDWLQQGENASDRLATPPAPRFDLVYLEAWRQPVSSVEDNEGFEVALGARDTSIKIRTMRRVRVRQGVTSTDCEEAFGTLLNDLGALGLNEEAELISDALLKVEPDGTAARRTCVHHPWQVVTWAPRTKPSAFNLRVRRSLPGVLTTPRRSTALSWQRTTPASFAGS